MFEAEIRRKIVEQNKEAGELTKEFLRVLDEIENPL